MPLHALTRHLPLASSLVLALASCAAPPALKPSGTPVDVAPNRVAAMEDRYRDAEVVWGGRIVGVRNLADTTEIVIEGYPLDASQRPQLRKDSDGRFVAEMPGYVESHDFPQGRFVSFVGRVNGTVADPAGAQQQPPMLPYQAQENILTPLQAQANPLPLLIVSSSHLWPPDYANPGPEMHFSIGVSGAIR
jgi:outer membrane lipoprotein